MYNITSVTELKRNYCEVWALDRSITLKTNFASGIIHIPKVYYFPKLTC